MAIFLFYIETRLLAFSESSANKIPLVLIVPPKVEDATDTWQQQASTVATPLRVEPTVPHPERLTPPQQQPRVILQIWSTL